MGGLLEHGSSSAALVIFALTYGVLGFGALPPLRIDRTGAALIGATAMIGVGVLTPREAVGAIDFHTIGLLFGMMIVVAHLRLAGFFRWLSERAHVWARTPQRMLLLTLWLSGAVSALFVNDTACVLLTPFALETAGSLECDPLPFLLAVAMGSNLGGAATIVGNPQNMLVASHSGISYARFAVVLVPVAVVGLAIASILFLWLFRGTLAQASPRHGAPADSLLDLPLLRKALVVAGLLFIALLAGMPPSLAALISASVLLITRRVDPQDVWGQIDWSLLTMFAGLFVVVAGVEHAGWAARGLGLLGEGGRRSLPTFIGVAAALSNLVSNVPAVLVLRTWAGQFASPERAWLALAMASSLAGNLTLVGSVANLIVVQQAKPRRKVGFWAYARVGVLLSLASLTFGYAWLLLVLPAH